MIIVIPLGGIGKRFSDFGYKDPKPFVRVLGKEIIFYVLDNLKSSKKDKIFIVYNNELEEFNFTERFGKYPNMNFFKLNFQTKGPVQTVYQITEIIEKDNLEKGLLILDGDTFYKKNIIKLIDPKKNTIIYHKTKIKEPIFSYVKIKNSKVIKIAEKIKISNNANTGAYYFKSINLFNTFAKNILKKNKKSYVSDVYKDMLKKKIDVFGKCISNDDFACLGTPQQIINFAKQTKIQKKRICFDLDNTLVTYPKRPGDYKSVQPIEKNIKFLNFLKSIGHYIIVFTARRMRTHRGNILKVKKDIEKLTIDQLKSFKIKYDEIIFGKPYAHYYIDDLSINPFQNLNIKLGYYEEKDFLTRNFNQVTIGEKFTIKTSKNLRILNNQLKYLKKIPNKIKYLYPKVFSYGKNWYKMETINGVKYSYLLVNNLLTTADIDFLFKKIEEVHSAKNNFLKNNFLLNYYDNYSKKLNLRISNDKKTIKIFGEKNYQKLNHFLKEYELKNKGKLAIIHGDPVMSNIIKKSDGNIVFLDPRGSIGQKFSLHGDIFYDFAKIYQSLNGYENIILDKNIDQKYLNYLKKYFEKKISNKFGKDFINIIKHLTISLYLSLLTFHNKKYKYKFISIAKSLIKKI